MRSPAAWLLFSAVVMACSPPQPEGFRDLDVPITATTRFTPQAFSGVWHVVAAYPNAVVPVCADQSWLVASEQLEVRCDQTPLFDAPLEVDPRGVIQVQKDDLDRGARAFWVMWMDEDAQTAVIGTTAGEMGWILDRTPGLRPDRLAAAREVLAFNGYDLAELEETGL